MKRFSLPLAALLAALVGCDSRPPLPPTFSLAGTVKVDGKPLSEGTISLHPADAGNPAGALHAPVVDGQYSLPVVPKGSYRASFRGGKPAQESSGPVSSDFNAPDPKGKKDPVPAKYQQPSLPVEVTADNRAQNFDLSSK